MESENSELIRQPNLTRDTGFLLSSEVACIVLGLTAQIILANSIIESDFGIFIIIIDAFATLFLLVDLGLPTIILREIPLDRSNSKKILHSVFSMQFVFSLIVIPIGFLMGFWLWGFNEEWESIVVLMALVAFFRVMTYSHKAAMRSLGEARFEAIAKILERGIITIGYIILFWLGINQVSKYAIVMLIGVFVTAIYVWIIGEKITRKEKVSNREDNSESRISLLKKAIPFTLTLAIVPLIARLDKFLIAIFIDYDAVAMYQIAFLMYMAGLSLPISIQLVLLPIFSKERGDDSKINEIITRSSKLIWWVIPPTILLGAILSLILIPILFPEFFVKELGDKGGSSIGLFMTLLSAYALTMLATPYYVSIQAGNRPWKYTKLLAGGLVIDAICGVILIPKFGINGAAWSTVFTRLGILLISIKMVGNFNHQIKERRKEIILCIGAITFSIFANSAVDGNLGNNGFILAVSALIICALLSGWKISPPESINLWKKEKNTLI